MGIMSKFKNMFTEEIEDEPIKKEVIQVEIPAPAKVEKEIRKEIKLEPITEKTEPKKEVEPLVKEEKEEKFTFPVFFDDKDFDTMEKPKKEVKPERKVEPYSGKGLEVPREKPKTFKPTPVISPVFGVLDKNYKKEDITDKTEIYAAQPSRTVSVDDIRKKAYGTLEDDLESSLLQNDFYEEPAIYRSEKDMFDDFDLLENEPVKVDEDSELLDFAPPLRETRESRFEHIEEDKLSNEQSDEFLTSKKEDNDDLFDLIDSMYEKGDKES